MSNRVQCRKHCGNGGLEKDGFFKNKQAENIHYLRKHTNKTWKTSGGKGIAKRRRPVGGQVTGSDTSVATLPPATTKAGRLREKLVVILRQNPEGMRIAEICKQLRQQGISAPTPRLQSLIADAVRHHPQSGVYRVERSVYGLRENPSEITPSETTTPKKTRRTKRTTQEIPEESGPVLSDSVKVAILQAENQRQREVLMRSLQAFGEITLLATSPLVKDAD